MRSVQVYAEARLVYALAAINLNPKVNMNIYKLYIRPIMEYGSLIFQMAPDAHLQHLQTLQNKIIRATFNFPRILAERHHHHIVGTIKIECTTSTRNT